MEKNWAVIGCGWLGLPFAKHQIKIGNNVIGSTTSLEKIQPLREDGISPILLSAEGKGQYREVFKSCNYLLLNIPPSSLKEKYPEAMLNIVNQFPKKTKVIFISSTSVYEDTNQVATESDDLDGQGRNAPYIIEAERVLQKKLNDRLTIIRMAGLVGGNRHPAKFMSGKSYTYGKDKINLIHLDDCLGIINQVIKRRYFGEVVNACCTKHPQKMEYYTWAAKKMDIIPPRFEDIEGKWKEVSNKKSKISLKYFYKYESPFEFPL